MAFASVLSEHPYNLNVFCGEKSHKSPSAPSAGEIARCRACPLVCTQKGCPILIFLGNIEHVMWKAPSVRKIGAGLNAVLERVELAAVGHWLLRRAAREREHRDLYQKGATPPRTD